MRKNQFTNKHGQEDSETKKDTDQVLFDTQWANLDVDTSVLNDKNLGHCGDYLNYDEKLVVAEMLEYVNLPIVDLSGIDFVELLHEDESVEEYGAVLEELRVVTNDVV